MIKLLSQGSHPLKKSKNEKITSWVFFIDLNFDEGRKTFHRNSPEAPPVPATRPPCAAALPPRLEVLGLEHNALGDSGAAALAAQIGGGGGGTPPGGGGGSGLASPTPRAALTALDLAGNGIGDDGLLPLLDALACNERLQQLDLRDNPIQQKALALEPSVALLGGGAAVKPRVLLQ